MGGRGASFSGGAGAGANLTSLKDSYQSLLKKQADLGRNMLMGSAKENARARKQWNANRQKLNKMQKMIHEAEGKRARKLSKNYKSEDVFKHGVNHLPSYSSTQKRNEMKAINSILSKTKLKNT